MSRGSLNFAEVKKLVGFESSRDYEDYYENDWRDSELVNVHKMVLKNYYLEDYDFEDYDAA